MEPTVGRIVHYTLTESNAYSINKRRKDAVDVNRANVGDGAQLHVGNFAKAGDVLPLLIVKVHEDSLVNGQVFLDGTDVLWVTSVPIVSLRDPGNPWGCWSWPPLV